MVGSALSDTRSILSCCPGPLELQVGKGHGISSNYTAGRGSFMIRVTSLYYIPKRLDMASGRSKRWEGCIDDGGSGDKR